MTVAASTTLFAVVFSLFVVAALVLVVLTLRFVVDPGADVQGRVAGRPGR